MFVSGTCTRSVARAASLASALVFLSALGWMALPASHVMDIGSCGIDLATGAQALLRLRIALALQPATHLLGPWVLMVLAMSPLLAAPSLRHLAVTVADQPTWEILIFLAAYALVWVSAVPIFLVSELGIDLLAAEIATPPLAVTATLALAWQVSPWRRHALKLCARSMWLSSRSGPRRGLELGLMTGMGCLGTCWALMLAPMSLAGDGRWLMVLVTLFLFVERVIALCARPGRVGYPFA